MQRFFGDEADAITKAFDRSGSRRAILVPWDYDPSCRVAIWGQSARWVTTRQPGVFSATPRPTSEWIDGVPTFDLFFADLEPYPHGLFFQRGYRGTDRLRTEPSLGAVEYFDLYRGMPSREMIQKDPVGALRQWERWKAANPQGSRKYPAYEVLDRIRGEIEEHLQKPSA